MTELVGGSGCAGPGGGVAGAEKISAKKFSYIGMFTCLATLILAFIFKDSFMYVLSYLDNTANENVLEFHLILIVLFVGVSLPMLWGYTICILICAYVYSFMLGFCLVVAYSTLGMTMSFFICRYVFYECANERVKDVQYLRAILTLIESREKGLYIVFLSRLMPIPFGLANTIFALTDIEFKKYIVSSIAGLVPSQLILCYIGSTLKSMSDVLENDSTARTASVVFVVQLVVAVMVMYYILKAAKLELDKHMSSTCSSKIPCELGSGSTIGLLQSSVDSMDSVLVQKMCTYGCATRGNTNSFCESCKSLLNSGHGAIIQMA